MRRTVTNEKEDKKQNKYKKNRKYKNINIKIDRKKMLYLIWGFVFFIGIIIINNYTSLGIVLKKNIDNNDVIQIELQTANSKVVPFGNEILVFGNGKITSYNIQGKKTGEIYLDDIIDPDIQTSGKYIQVIDKDKGIVYVYKNKYEVARIKTNGQIYSGNINSDGTSVIEYSANGNKGQIGIYDNNGKIRYNIKLGNGIIGKYVLSDNSRFLTYVDVNTQGISLCTNINLVDLHSIKEDYSNITTIHTVDNALAYDIYWEGKNIIARLDDNYMRYNISSNKKEIIKISERQVVNVSDCRKRFASISIDKEGNYMLSIRKFTSDAMKEILIENAPKHFEYENGIAYICYGKKIEAYNDFGMKLKHYDSDFAITTPIIFNNGRSLAMLISNKLIFFTI